MKATGLVRRLDHAGRLCVPKELHTVLHICEDDPVEFYVDGDRIVMKRYDAVGDMQQLLFDTEKRIRTAEMLPQGTVDALLGKLDEMKNILSQNAL